MVGVSASTAEEVRAAAESGVADLVGIGPVWATPTKTDAAAPLGPEGLAALAGPQDESWAVWTSPSLLMMGMCAPFPDDRQSGVTVLRKGGGAPGARRHWSGGIARGVAMNLPGTGRHNP